MDDLLIRGGHVIDGSGAPGRDADVAVRERPDRGRSSRARPARPAASIDARGLVVAPGFIDIHTHSDFTLPLNPRAESKIRQGVTTEVVGNCGFSVAPALPGTAAMLREYLASSAPWLDLPRDARSPTTSAALSADVGQRDPPGRPQHAAADDGGHGRTARSPPDELARDGAPARGGARGRRLGALVRALHRARRLRGRRRDPRARARAPRATAPPTPRTCATRPTTSSTPCARRSPSPRPPACTCRSRT